MQIHNNTLIAECSTYDFKEMLERKKVKSWLKSVSAFRHEDKSGNGHVIVKNAFSFISIPLFIYDWKIQCKMPPKTKRFYPLVPK